MTGPQRLLELVAEWEPPYEAIWATSFTFEPDFFAADGVLPAMAGLGSERPSSGALVWQRLGAPYVGVLQGGPSQGKVGGWIERAIWDSPGLGLLHAKCVVAAGPRWIHCLVTSANLTEESWRFNRELAVVVSCRRDGTGAHAGDVAAVLGGLRRLGQRRGMSRWVEVVERVAARLPAPDPGSAVVWSGLDWPGAVLDRLPTGSVMTATSPFWPDDAGASRRIVDGLSALAPTVQIVTRGSPEGDLFEAPAAFVEALAVWAPEASVAVSAPTDTGEPQERTRRLHGKQLTVETADGPVSYVGSANVTVRGLGLAPRSNVELGVVADVDVLVSHLGFEVMDPARRRDVAIDDEPVIDVTEFVSGLAVLHAERLRLEIVIDPGPVRWTSVEVPVDGAEHPLPGPAVEIFLDAATYQQVADFPELRVRSASSAARLPVILDDDAKHDVGALGGDVAFDSFLAGFGSTVGLDESAEEDGGAGPAESEGEAVPPGAGKPVKVRAVHRARDAIERLEAHERALRDRITADPRTVPGLVEWWLRGPSGVVSLAKRVREAAAEGPPLVTPTAAAFILTEIEALLRRLVTSFPHVAAPVRRAQQAVAGHQLALLANVDPDIWDEIQQLQPRGARR